jgi:hypothetical protein
MSTYYRPIKPIHMFDLFDGRLAAFNVSEWTAPYTSETSRCLFDGANYIWVHSDLDGGVSLKRSGLNNPDHILASIARTFDTDIVSEYEPQFWGFDSQEEWDAAEARSHEEHEERFSTELVKFLAGEPCDIRPGTIGMTWAEIARELVSHDPELATPAAKRRLLKEVHRIYDRDHAVVVRLTTSEIDALEAVWNVTGILGGQEARHPDE